MDEIATIEKKKKVDKAKEQKINEQVLMSKLQSKFSPGELRQYFSVDTTCDNEDDWAVNGPVNDSTDKIKCMPNAFPNAVKIVDKLYKTFNQMFFGSQNQIEIRCDFIEDQNGLLYFLKIDKVKVIAKSDMPRTWILS